MQHTKIKTFEDACKATKRDPNTLPDVSMTSPEMGAWIAANYKMAVIAEALNGDWKPDFSNHDQNKYVPWFYNKKGSSSASGFSCDDYDCGNAHTHVAARLCFKSAEVAKYAGTQFIDLYRVIITR